jgi:hypothetical protein
MKSQVTQGKVKKKREGGEVQQIVSGDGCALA